MKSFSSGSLDQKYCSSPPIAWIAFSSGHLIEGDGFAGFLLKGVAMSKPHEFTLLKSQRFCVFIVHERTNSIYMWAMMDRAKKWSVYEELYKRLLEAECTNL